MSEKLASLHKVLASLLLLLHCMAVTVSPTCQEEAVEIIGTVTAMELAGRLEICVGGAWHAIYDEEWSIADVRLVCAEKGFPSECAVPCGNSCFGASTLPTGYAHFTCSKTNEFRFCDRFPVLEQLPDNNAGITCTMIADGACLPFSNSTQNPRTTTSGPNSTPSPHPIVSPNSTACPDCSLWIRPTRSSPSTDNSIGSPDTTLLPTVCPKVCPTVSPTACPAVCPTTCPTASPTASPTACPTACATHTSCPTLSHPNYTPNSISDCNQSVLQSPRQESLKRERCTAMGAALGTIIITLLVILVGVVTGWVWTYRKNKIMLKKWDQRKTDGQDDMLLNTCYSQSMPSSLGEGQGEGPGGDYETIEPSVARQSGTTAVGGKAGSYSILQRSDCYTQETSSTSIRQEQAYESLEFDLKK